MSFFIYNVFVSKRNQYNDMYERITVLKDEDLPEKFRPESIYRLPNDEFKIRSQEFKNYLQENKIYYYARPRETFFKFEAFELADAAGCSKLLLEDMS